MVLQREESLVFDSEGKAVHSEYLLYKVLTQKGAQGWDELSYTWEPWRDERPVMRARVITADKVVHPLDPATIVDAAARETDDSVFSDRRIMRAPLPAMAPGSLVEEEQSSREALPFFGAGSVERIFVGMSAPVQHARVILDAPATLPLRYDVQLLPDLKPQRTEADGRVRVVFDLGPLEPWEDLDPGLPSDVPAYPNITFSTGVSWQSVAEEYSKIVDKQIAAADLKSVVTRLTAGKASRQEKVAAILQYLDHEVRYTGVEFGDAAVVPRAPAETLTRKYGDCKDKAALLVALLRTADISAYVALLNIGNRADVSAELPGMGMFDHAIVFAPGDPDLWIDATDEYARLGQLPASDQGRLALVARTASSALIRIPVSASTENLLLEKREIDLAENGPARIVETTLPQGSVESSYRRAYVDEQNKSVKEDLTNYVKSQYLAEGLDRLHRSDPADLSVPFELVLESNRAKRGVTDLEVAAAAIRFDALFNRLPSDLQQREKEDDPKADSSSGKKLHKKRTADYQIAEAFVTEWQYTVVPPAGFTPKPLPPDAKISLGPALLTESFSAGTDNIVHATIRFDSAKRRFTAAEAAELQNQIAKTREGAPIVIYFEPVGQKLLNQGRVREALQSYRDLIALEPKGAIHHLQLAKALLGAGMGEAARAEAQAAVKLEPTSALAQKTLASIFEYDSIGRRLRPGSDYDGAAAAFRSAEKLDPDDKTIVGDLAILLEYDHWGARYGQSGPLKDSIVEYRKLTPQKRVELGVQNNLPFTLFYAGEFSDAEKEAEALNPQLTALIVACEAALHGSQVAITEARKRTAGEEQFKQIALNAGQLLANIRQFPLAADLQEIGATGENASGTAAFAALYRKTQPHEKIIFSDDPDGVALAFDLLSSSPELTLERFRAACSRNGKVALAVPDAVDLLMKQEKAMFSKSAREGSFAQVGLDLMLTRAQPKTQGDDTSGYKVTLYPSANYKLAIYVVKEDGHYKVLATSRSPAAIGLEVLDRLAANDVSGARVLLDWVREDEHLAGGDDPLAGAPFPRFWTKGKDADAAEMRLAAGAILTSRQETATQGLAILQPAMGSITNEAERLNVALAMLEGYSLLEEYDKALGVCVDLAKQYPESLLVFLRRAYALRALGRFDEAEQLAQDRLKRIPDDLDAMRSLVFDAAARLEYAKAHSLDQKIIDEGKAEPSDLNSIAWLSLFTAKVEASDVDDALKASELSNKNTSMLHTLGCVYVEVGKTKEAREVLVEAMDSLNLDEPDENYWYAFGRIAEQDGELAVALADYARVTKPKNAPDIPESTYTLAQIRIAALKHVKTQTGI